MVREWVQVWPGLHTLLRWHGQFSKIVAMGQLLTRSQDKAIALTLKADLVHVKKGSFRFAHTAKHVFRVIGSPLSGTRPLNCSVGENEMEAETEGVDDLEGDWVGDWVGDVELDH